MVINRHYKYIVSLASLPLENVTESIHVSLKGFTTMTHSILPPQNSHFNFKTLNIAELSRAEANCLGND